MGYKVNNAVKTGGIPTHIVSAFLEDLDIPEFIELGSAAGDSAKWASQNFKEVISIELIEGRIQPYNSADNIAYLIGDTVELLPTIINNLNEKKGQHRNWLIENNMNIDPVHRYVFWWIDSHYSGDTPNDSGYKDCPLLEELDIISAYANDSIILIDDARLFMGNPPYPNNAKDWPAIQQIFKMFEEKFPFFVVTIVDDYILAFPDRIEWIYQKHWMDNFSKRYPNESEKLRQQVKDVYEAFKNYIQ